MNKRNKEKQPFDTDDVVFDLITMHEFREEKFAIDNRHFFDEYITLRLHGHNDQRAFLQVFGFQYRDDSYTPGRIVALESNPYYVREFKRRVKAMQINDGWNVGESINELLSLLRGPATKCATRLNAIKELNVLASLTFIDQDGNSRAGRTLDDFYKNSASLMEKMPSIETNPPADEQVH